MARVRWPDHVLFRWLELRERLSSASAAHPVAELGLWYRKSCPECQGHEREERHEDDRRAWVCARCGHLWPVDFGTILRGEVQTSLRQHRGEAMFHEMAVLHVALQKLSMWQQRIYLLLYLYENVGSYDQVAAEATLRWPRSTRYWDERKVGRVVRDGRAILAKSLHLRTR